jgi:PhnB protein
MSLNVYLFFNKQCEEAMNFYADALEGTIDSLVRYGDAPMPSSDAYKNLVMHGVVMIGNIKIMCSDSSEHTSVQSGNQVAISITYPSEQKMEASFKKLTDGGKVTMALQETFWGAKFGMCIDKYGISWMFNYDKPKG